MNAKPNWLDLGSGRHFTRLEVTRVLWGAPVTLGLHVITGKQDGPTLGIIGCIHGDETLPVMAFRRLMARLDPDVLAGRLAVMPVANPLSLAVFDRQTPEQHGNTDLHTVFPGNREKGNLTNQIAITIQHNLLDHVDAFVDFHSGGSGGRLQNRSDFHDDLPAQLRNRCLDLCRAFGAPFIHANNLSKTATSIVNGHGKPTCNAEAGGSYLGPGPTAVYLERMAEGLENIMVELGMLPSRAAVEPPRQLLFNFKNRIEVNPGVGGFLNSNFESPDDLGTIVSAGNILGEIVDLHTLEVSEVLKAPEDGYLFFSRYSGPVDAGTKAFALARADAAEWLE
jgi:predicted deacylase